MFVINMTLEFFFGWPTKLRVFAASVRAFPRSGMGFLMLGEIARALERSPAYITLLRRGYRSHEISSKSVIIGNGFVR